MTWKHVFNGESQILCAEKDCEKYLIFMDYDPRSHEALLSQTGVLAADKDIAFNWYDAAVLANFVKQNMVIHQS